MQNDDEALLSISLTSCGQLVKIFIALEPHGILSINFAYLYILRLSSVYQMKLNNINTFCIINNKNMLL